MPLTVAGVLLPGILPHCLLCLCGVDSIKGGNVPWWTRLVSLELCTEVAEDVPACFPRAEDLQGASRNIWEAAQEGAGEA